MLRTRAQMQSTVLSALGNHSQATAADVLAILQACARELTEEHEWGEREREAIVTLVAPYTTGTLTATNGSATLTGSGTTWTSAMVGRAISIEGLDAFLRVASFSSVTSITLGDAQGSAVTWPGDTAASLTYSIFGLDYELAADVDTVLGGTEQFSLIEVSPDVLDAMDPKRLTRRAEPTHYAIRRRRLDGSPNDERVFIEFFPVASAATLIRVPYLCVAPALDETTSLPACPSQLIELLTTSRVADYLFSKTGETRWAALSDRYYRRLYGGPGDPGALEKLKEANGARRSYPRFLGQAPVSHGLDFHAAHDVEVL